MKSTTALSGLIAAALLIGGCGDGDPIGSSESRFLQQQFPTPGGAVWVYAIEDGNGAVIDTARVSVTPHRTALGDTTINWSFMFTQGAYGIATQQFQDSIELPWMLGISLLKLRFPFDVGDAWEHADGGYAYDTVVERNWALFTPDAYHLTGERQPGDGISYHYDLWIQRDIGVVEFDESAAGIDPLYSRNWKLLNYSLNPPGSFPVGSFPLEPFSQWEYKVTRHVPRPVEMTVLAQINRSLVVDDVLATEWIYRDGEGNAIDTEYVLQSGDTLLFRDRISAPDHRSLVFPLYPQIGWKAAAGGEDTAWVERQEYVNTESGGYIDAYKVISIRYCGPDCSYREESWYVPLVGLVFRRTVVTQSDGEIEEPSLVEEWSLSQPWVPGEEASTDQ